MLIIFSQEGITNKNHDIPLEWLKQTNKKTQNMTIPDADKDEE